MTVLYVDNNDDRHLGWEEFIEGHGHNVILVDSLEAAKKDLHKATNVIIDVSGLGAWGGLLIAQEIAKLRPELPITVSTMGDIDTLRNAPPQIHVIKKPMLSHHFLDALSRATSTQS